MVMLEGISQGCVSWKPLLALHLSLSNGVTEQGVKITKAGRKHLGVELCNKSMHV